MGNEKVRGTVLADAEEVVVLAAGVVIDIDGSAFGLLSAFP